MRNFISDFCPPDDLIPRLVNISGGGLGIYSKMDVPAGNIVECCFTLTLPVEKTVRVYARVLKSYITSFNNFKLHLVFEIITEKIRDLIIEFVFAYERYVLKNNQMVSLMKFIELPMNKLIEGKPLPFELFALIDGNIKFLSCKGLTYDNIAKEFFKNSNVMKLYIEHTEDPLLDEYFGRNKKVVKLFNKEDPVSFNNYSFTKKQLHRIDKNALLPKSTIIFQLFCSNDYNYQLLLDASNLQPCTITETVLSDNKPLFIDVKDIPNYLDYISALNESDNLSTPMFIKEKSKALLHLLLNDLNQKGVLFELITFPKDLYKIVTDDLQQAIRLILQSQDDFYAYCHMFNTALLLTVVSVINKVPYKDAETLILAGLLHDIGFVTLNELIIDKNGRLSTRESALYKTHVTEGTNILKNFAIIPNEAISAVMHHHENCTASGFPVGLSENEISNFGKWLAIVDTFDSYLVNQPFKSGLSIEQAVKTMIKTQPLFDKGFLKTFLAIILKTLL